MTAPKPLWRLLPWIVAALLALALPAVWLLRPKLEERMLQFEVYAPPGYTFGTSNAFRWSPKSKVYREDSRKDK